MERIKKVSLNDVKTPFNRINVSGFDFLEIEGYQFPLKHPKYSAKDSLELKDPARIPEMINRLKKHSIEFNQFEENDAAIFLKQVNYYRLAVFEKYLHTKPACYSELKYLYQFDVFLRRSLESLIEPIEVFLKTSLAYFLTNNYSFEINQRNYGSLAYLNPSIYKAKKVKNGSVKEMLSEFFDALYRNVEREPSLQHHIEYYGGNIPMWVLVEHLTMGNIKFLITNLDRSVRKRWVDSELVDSNGEAICKNNNLIPSWIETIRLLRNTCAHGGRFYSHRFPFNPTLDERDEQMLQSYYPELENISEKEMFKHTFFGGLVVVRRFYSLLSLEDQNNWDKFIIELSNYFRNPQIVSERLGLSRFAPEAFLLTK